MSLERDHKNRIREIKLVAERLAASARHMLASEALPDAASHDEMLNSAARLVVCVKHLPMGEPS